MKQKCKYVKRLGESCTLNNNCKYPKCNDMKKYRLTIANLRAYNTDKFCYEVYRLLDEYGTHDTTYIKVIEGDKTILIEDEEWMLSNESEQYPELDGVIKDLKLIGWI